MGLVAPQDGYNAAEAGLAHPRGEKGWARSGATPSVSRTTFQHQRHVVHTTNALAADNATNGSRFLSLLRPPSNVKDRFGGPNTNRSNREA
jgi:hypothetical protein